MQQVSTKLFRCFWDAPNAGNHVIQDLGLCNCQCRQCKAAREALSGQCQLFEILSKPAAKTAKRSFNKLMRVNVYLKRWTRILALSHVTWPHCHFLVPIPEHSLSTNSSSASTIRRNFKSRRSRSTPQSCETWSLISPDVPKPKIACKNLQKIESALNLSQNYRAQNSKQSIQPRTSHTKTWHAS